MSKLNKLKNLWGIEIINAKRYKDIGIKLWDSQISQGKRIWATGGDDAYNTSQVGKAWIMVNSSSKSLSKIVKNMKNGNF